MYFRADDRFDSFKSVTPTTFSCRDLDKCLFGTLGFYFYDLELYTKLIDITIDGYGERIVKVLI